MIRALISLLVFFLMFDGVALAQGRRIALVIGVSKYKNVPQLANTANDANSVGAALRRLGFAVDLVIDPDRNAMESSIRNLGRKAEGAEASVFYYAGHAIEVGGQNLLVPAPANIQSDRDLRYETVDLDSVLDAVAGRANVSLLFLDSCRDNPFAKKLTASSRAVTFRGLGAVDAATGTLIAFATAPGKTAEDGDNQNSPFTTALLRNIERPGIEVRRMLGEIRREVRETTKGRQIPWENSALEGEFYFKPAAPEPAPAPAPKQAVAAVAANDPADLRQNLRKAVLKIAPGVGSAHLDIVVKAYGEGKDNKAMAVSRERNLTWRFTGLESAYAAEQSVLEACQLHYASPCVLVAVNGTLANIPEDGAWVPRTMSRLTYDGQFNPEQVPIIRPETRGRRDVSDYAFARRPKAIALHPWGLLSVSTGGASQAAAEADALKTCNDDPRTAGNDGPCFLYAIGNHVVLPLRITGTRSLAKTIAEAIRLVGPARAEEAYRAARHYKALVIEPESGIWNYWDGAQSAEAAERSALAQCQINTAKPCILMAIGDALVANDPPAARLSDMESLRAEGRYDLNKLPFLASASRDTANQYSMLPMPKAMAIKAIPPRYISATGATVAEAEQKALQECNQISGSTCMLYAENDSIILPRRLTAPPP